MPPEMLRYEEGDPRDVLVHGRRPEIDAVLMIGDQALRHRICPGFRTIDLAGSWTKHTGLPFVFAAWIARKDVLRDHPDGRWTVVHELNACGTARSSLYAQGLVNFFVDDLVAQDAKIVWPDDETSAALVALLTRDPSRVHDADYSVIARFGSAKYQNSTAWVLETIGAAEAGGPHGPPLGLELVLEDVERLLVDELAVLPQASWATRLIGSNALVCLTAIPLFALAPLAGLIPARVHALVYAYEALDPADDLHDRHEGSRRTGVRLSHRTRLGRQDALRRALVPRETTTVATHPEDQATACTRARCWPGAEPVQRLNAR